MWDALRTFRPSANPGRVLPFRPFHFVSFRCRKNRMLRSGGSFVSAHAVDADAELDVPKGLSISTGAFAAGFFAAYPERDRKQAAGALSRSCNQQGGMRDC